MRWICALACAAALMAPAAQAAKWVKVGSAAGTDSYVDKASIIPVKDQFKAWTLVSHESEQTSTDGTRYRSLKALHQYSCSERTATLLSQVYYPQPMGKGPMLQNIRYEKFAPEDIIPDSPSDEALQLICKSKKAGK